MTRAELVATANQLARELSGHGVGEGDFVTIALPNSVDWFVGYVAVREAAVAVVERRFALVDPVVADPVLIDPVVTDRVARGAAGVRALAVVATLVRMTKPGGEPAGEAAPVATPARARCCAVLVRATYGLWVFVPKRLRAQRRRIMPVQVGGEHVVARQVGQRSDVEPNEPQRARQPRPAPAPVVLEGSWL